MRRPTAQSGAKRSRGVIGRREFTKTLGATVGLYVLPGAVKAARQEIDYIRKEIPRISVPAYHGTRNVQRVPDTLDLAERARLAINALTGLCDPDADYECYFVVQVNRKPLVMSHEWSDFVGAQPKFMEALTLLRTITGDTSAKDVELGMMTAAAHMLGEDGLYYQPIRGRPWALIDSRGEPVTTGTAFSTGLARGELKRVDQNPLVMKAGQFSDAYSCGRMLLAMTLWYEREKKPFWRNRAEGMINRFRELAVDRGDYAYFPRPFIHPGFLTPGERPDPAVSDISSHFTHLGAIHGMSRYYRVTGYEPALQLAGKLSRYMRDHSGHYDPEGRAPDQHFHGSTCTLLAMLEYAALARDQALLDFVRQSYEWHRTIGSALVGFFPEVVSTDYPTCESCELANMIDLAVRMSQLGVGDYWDDADRYLRNQFAENQLTHGEWMQEVSDQFPKAPVSFRDTAHDVIRRNIGGFAGWSLGNDFIPVPEGPIPRGFAFMHCCTGNASRAIYYAWQGILTHEGGKLQINLLLNRASAWADVHSYIPYDGRVEVLVKQRCHVSVRAPEWVEKSKVTLQVAEANRPVNWNGRFLEVGDCVPQSKVSIAFPLPERTQQETIGARQYTLTLKGNDVVAIDPAGKYCPYYQREKYRQGKVQWKSLERFVSDEALLI
jgi:hypothetical protein